MIYCHVKPEKLLKLNLIYRRRQVPLRIEDLMRDPSFRAMIKLRQMMQRGIHSFSEEERKIMEEDMKHGRTDYNTRHLET
jgi:hypothetical protein